VRRERESRVVVFVPSRLAFLIAYKEFKKKVSSGVDSVQKTYNAENKHR